MCHAQCGACHNVECDTEDVTISKTTWRTAHWSEASPVGETTLLCKCESNVFCNVELNNPQRELFITIGFVQENPFEYVFCGFA